MPAACEAFVERYSFSSFPQSIDEMAKEPISFAHGLFNGAAIESFDIYSDGVIISSKSSTDVLDNFLADLNAWSKSKLGLDRVETHTISRLYESHVMVRTDKNILKPLSQLAEMSKLLSAGVKKASGQEVVFEPFGIALAPDSSKTVGLKPIAFRLERKAGIEFPMHFYLSSAPLRTKDHIALLQRLDGLV